ncbi:504_t:CDS:2, partial [Dentiscutata erythropus]
SCVKVRIHVVVVGSIVGGSGSPGNYDNDEAPNDYDNSESHCKVAPIAGDFALASSYVQQTNSQMSLVNIFKDLEVIPDESSNVLAEHD